MKWLSDETLGRLRAVVDEPDLSETAYELIDRVASGGMGTVYLVRDTKLDREIALKVTNTMDSTGELAARMLREARIVARLEHPGIVPVHDVGTLPDGRVFYTMKYVQGRRLDQYAQDAASPADLLRIFEKACEAVAFAHAHAVLHRDLKPENIMVGPFGEVLVMDWGVAKALREDRVSTDDFPDKSVEGTEDREGPASEGPSISIPAVDTMHGTVMGTPAYMSPEQALGEIGRLDERTDVYALGAILYFLLTKRPPFGGDSKSGIREEVVTAVPLRPRQISREIPRRLEAICLKAMSKDRAARYRTSQELAADVGRYLDGFPVSAYRESLYERASRWAGKNRPLIMLILAYILMRAIVLLVWGR